MTNDIDRETPSVSSAQITMDNEVEDLRRRLEEEERRYLRLLAEFDTFRRRAAREQDAAAGVGRLEALRPLLPVLDTLERALAVGSSDASFYEGVVATERLFVSVLNSMGVQPIESLVGALFDPSVHEAIATADAPDRQPGTIVRTVRRGWQYRNEVLRPAQVIVAAVSDGQDRDLTAPRR